MTGGRRAAGLAAATLIAVVATACGADDVADPGPGSPPTVASATSTPPTATRSSETAATTAPTLPPPYIEGADWVQTEVGASLQIRPTPNGRSVSGDGAGDRAWREVLALHPDADTPGMREQFDCHWTFARLVEPDKPSWNIEPARPVVSPEEMIAARCNPGAAEEE